MRGFYSFDGVICTLNATNSKCVPEPIDLTVLGWTESWSTYVTAPSANLSSLLPSRSKTQPRHFTNSRRCGNAHNSENLVNPFSLMLPDVTVVTLSGALRTHCSNANPIFGYLLFSPFLNSCVLVMLRDRIFQTDDASLATTPLRVMEYGNQEVCGQQPRVWQRNAVSYSPLDEVK
jgi:hypothetical protein